MSESWMVDPASGDYILDENGKPVIDTGLKTPAFIRLRTHRLKWLYAPDATYGSDFYAFKIRRSVSDQKSTKALAMRALRPMLVDKRASAITVTILQNTRNMTQFQATIVDAEGNPEQLSLVPIGGSEVAIDFKAPSDIAQEYLDELKLLKPEVNTAQKDSDWWIRAQVVGGVISGIYADQQAISNDAFPQRARHEALERHLETWFDPPDDTFKPASVAIGEVLAQGVTGSFMQKGTQWVYGPNGNLYQTTADLTLTTATTGVVPVSSINTGQNQNLLQGTQLKLSSTPPGFQQNGVVYAGDISDGRDQESDEQAAARILARIRAPLAGGRVTDYEQFALDADPTVVSANVLRFPFGFGTVGVIITAGTADIDTAIDNGDPVVITPSQELVDTVQAYIETKKPVTDCVYVAGANPVAQDVTVRVAYVSGHNDSPVLGTTPALTQAQIVQREVMRAIYKTPAGGRLLGGSGFIVASDIEATIDIGLSAEPHITGTLQILLDRQVDNLSASGSNRMILGNEAAIPGTITVIEM